MTPWIISFSSSSIPPSSLPDSTSIFSSSMDREPPFGRSLPPSARTRTFDTVETNQTIGRRIHSNQPIGRATTSANRSAKVSASVFGTSSPMMIEARAMNRVTSTKLTSAAASCTNASGMSRTRAARDRRAEHGVDADERAVADDRPVLGLSVEVGGHRTGADIDLGTHLGVAEVAEVMLLRAGADRCLLELGEVADPASGPDLTAGP